MTVKDLEDKLGYEAVLICTGTEEITGAYTSDLLSDVMGNAPDDSVLITIQAHKNTIAVASLAGIKAIVMCNGRKAPDDMLEAAEGEDINLFTTPDDQFTASWKIHKELS